jgi:Domain of Unknown Function (DUF1259)
MPYLTCSYHNVINITRANISSRKTRMYRQSFLRLTTFFLLAYGFTSASSPMADGIALDVVAIQSITGLKGVLNQTKGTFKIAKPRDDVPVAVEQNRLVPFMGLTSWAAFMPHGKDNAMVMGDMVLFEDEVNLAMSAALKAGLEVTALHNHFFFDKPKVYFMHIGGEGSISKLAQGVRAIFDTEKDIRAKTPAPADSFSSGRLPDQNAIDGNAISEVFGQKGDAKDGMYKVTVGRAVQMAGMDVGNTMGVNTWAGFAGTPDEALVLGTLPSDDVSPLLRPRQSPRPGPGRKGRPEHPAVGSEPLERGR